MKYYNNVFRPIAPPVDMSILQNTYNTLEQGHLKGVELASKLRSEIAQLPLNESEQGYKDELASGIEQVITENSFNENAYYAIPELVKAQGDIMSNPVLLNKIQAQADYKAFQDGIDANKELTADMKEYYKELNPYKSGQNENGTYDTTFKWSPIKTPTKVYDINDFIDAGIKRAAEEYTDYNSTVWLDSEGNVTRDPMKALNGEVYYTVGGQKVVLSKDKIIAAINTVIDSTPGGNESIQQDYDVYKWKYNKQKANANPDDVIVSPITDANGEVLSAEEFKQKLISEAASQAAYTKGGPKRTYGSGLKSYKEYQNKKDVDEKNAQLGLGNYIAGAFSQNIYSPENITIERNLGKEAVETKNDSSNMISTYFKSVFGEDNPNLAIKEKVDLLMNDETTPSSYKAAIRNYYRQYEESESTLEAFKTSLNDKEKEQFDFGTAINTPGGMIDINRSKYDKKAMNQLNSLFGDKDYVDIYLTSDQMNYLRNNNKSAFDVDNLMEDKGDHVRLLKDSAHSNIMMACTLIDNAFRENRNSFFAGRNLTSAAPTTNKEELNKRYAFSGTDASENTQFSSGIFSVSGGKYSSSPVKKLADLYRKAGEFSQIKSNNVQLNGVVKDIPLEALREGTFTEYVDKQAFNFGQTDLKPGEIRTRANEEYKYITQQLIAGIKPEENRVYASDENKDGKFRIVKDNPLVYNTIKKNISDAAAAGKISITPASVLNDRGVSEPGSWITIYNDTNKTVGQRYFVSGIGISDASEKLFGNYKMQVRDNLRSVVEFGDNKTIMSGIDLPYGGSMTVKSNPTNGNVDFNILGKTISIPYEHALILYEELEKYRDIYDAVATGSVQTEEQLASYSNLMNNEIIPTIAIYSEMPIEIVDDLLDLSKNIR